ncbi:hypothetical protein vB_PsyM_KIL4_0062 [Pseudomonas phage vB_PsyM_KIL4]|uniref:AP2/ERF domain-containing protein n=2 Tax=Flaumdravirus TaxID=2560133 RepID=A0A142IEY1_9CAUD|nr:hypothetical protein FDI83_gp151 [Pseudomonas phage vB_PsyM_KIL4]AMR57786.1 hypothetical protein vB_PsyM_KIL4_0062 [Pseudomonas phage vB_PsyM_KIL4]AMR57955.1 hypothetical protein vB_PsyM_KIL5_0064 [Pseudomonas phage vB_PsyM_KIL5]
MARYEWVSRSVQSRNRRKSKNSKSDLKGVAPIKNGLYQSNICIGSFQSETEAARAYDDISEYLFGTRPNKTQKVSD